MLVVTERPYLSRRKNPVREGDSDYMNWPSYQNGFLLGSLFTKLYYGLGFQPETAS